ncbi:dihydrodipicolinate synthase family protein, partial [Ralstonia pseudosolanacearum]|uniref:dihydrodipicolinate synthase family protein n=1 Tax=Ralstonia pseudosolanacearum TaxID=1310165 RepID=UPI003CED993A
QVIPILSLGGIGVISVLSNIEPKYTHEMCKTYFDGDFKKAGEMQIKAIPLINALFCEVNPTPVKFALKEVGFDFGKPRLPLTEPTETSKKIIKQEINKLEIKVHSLLYLNKLTYYKDMNEYKNGKINIVEILQESVKKFKITRPDIKWQIDILDKRTTFKGNHDLWEA